MVLHRVQQSNSHQRGIRHTRPGIIFRTGLVHKLLQEDCHGVPPVALKRKWCNFELSLAKQAGKNACMVTSCGVVQAGQVPPQALEQMSHLLIGFDCRDASCSSNQDSRLIDSAVEHMGGYEGLNAEVRGVVQEAILEAREWIDKAIHNTTMIGVAPPSAGGGEIAVSMVFQPSSLESRDAQKNCIAADAPGSGD